MKKQQLKDIITNQNELIEYWRTRSSGFERLYDQTDRILRMCENRNEDLSDENKLLKEQIGEIRECRDLEIEGIRKQHEFNAEQDRKEIDKLKYHVESLRTTCDCQAKEINRLRKSTGFTVLRK